MSDEVKMPKPDESKPKRPASRGEQRKEAEEALPKFDELKAKDLFCFTNTPHMVYIKLLDNRYLDIRDGIQYTEEKLDRPVKLIG